MKKLSILSLLCLFLIQFGYAQTVPQGMKYQAVARDLSGKILADQEIVLSISLHNADPASKSEYKELHQVVTNKFGLFTLAVGEGRTMYGNFDEIPWSTSDIYMAVSIKDDASGNFAIISDSRLLSVPYAFHAATAAALVDGNNSSHGSGIEDTGSGDGIESPYWTVYGNKNARQISKLGTTDEVDLLIVTNNVERLRVLSQGDIEIAENVIIAKGLKVDGVVETESEVFAGSDVFIAGSLTVNNQSPSLLSGKLTVDLQTDLNSSLNVDGPTYLNSSLKVSNMSPTTLSGSLLTMGDATFNEHVTLRNADYNSFTPAEGALVVAGGIGVGRNVTIGEDLEVIGFATFGKPVTMSTLELKGTDPSDDVNSGALVVAGGVGIGMQMNVGGKAKFGIGDFDPANYPLIIQGSSQGMAIKVNGSRSGSNKFVSFHDDHGEWGAIQGQTITEYLTEPEYLVEKGFLVIEGLVVVAEFSVSVVDGLIAGFEVVQAIANLLAASTSSTGCAGVGACVTVPIPSFIASNTTELVLKGINLVSAIANTVLIAANTVLVADELVTYEAFRIAQLGVTYSSGSGDYAEWLPKLDATEIFYPGDIVGVKGGYISKNTDGADYVMVISSRPIVLGNMPQKDDYAKFEKVAFMGQVPVKVFGKVEVGDYIIPSGNHNGFGITVAADNMRAEDYQKIVGIAWSASSSDHVGFVNVAVGLNSNDVTSLVIAQEEKLNTQEAEIKELKEQVEQISDLLIQLASGENAASVAEQMRAYNQESENPVDNSSTHVHEKIVYYEVTREQISESIELAKDMMASQGVDVNNHFFFNQLAKHPDRKERIIHEMKILIDNAALAQYEIDIKTGAIVEFDYEPIQSRNEGGLQKELIQMGIETAEDELKKQGVNTHDHPFFKKIHSSPEGMQNLVLELQQLLNNKG